MKDLTKITGTYLFLDDYRQPLDCAQYMYRKQVDCRIYHKEWDIVRSYKEFIDWVDINGLPGLISFDHDLGDVVELKSELPIESWFNLDNDTEYTGMDCAKWLIDYCLDHDLTVINLMEKYPIKFILK